MPTVTKQINCNKPLTGITHTYARISFEEVEVIQCLTKKVINSMGINRM